MKRSQTSMEYLIILAMLIILSLYIISINTNLRVFTSNQEQKNSNLWEETEIGIQDGMIGATSYMKIKNNFPNKITITNITLYSEATSFHILDQNITLKKYTSEEIDFSSQIEPVNCLGGDIYPLQITINYTDNLGINNTLEYDKYYNFDCN